MQVGVFHRTCQDIGWEKRLRNKLFCVRRKTLVNQSINQSITGNVLRALIVQCEKKH